MSTNDPTPIEQARTAVAGIVPDPSTHPTMKVEHAAAVLGISRNAAYEAVKRGELPSIRLGRSIRIPTLAITRMLELDVA